MEISQKKKVFPFLTPNIQSEDMTQSNGHEKWKESKMKGKVYILVNYKSDHTHRRNKTKHNMNSIK